MLIAAATALMVIGAVESLYSTPISQVALLNATENHYPALQPQLIDVRSSREYASGHISGAIHVPFWALGSYKNARLAPGQPVTIYCELGPRAGLAGLWLRINGYEKIAYLEGHMAAWRQSGLPIQRGPDEKRSSAIRE
jgi:rhodanese-related sulfurtransferase